MHKFSGCYTAIITPLSNSYEVDYEGVSNLVEFKAKEGVSGILAVGTTGESPTLDWNEHNQVIYVPTELNMPIMEANRLRTKK